MPIALPMPGEPVHKSERKYSRAAILRMARVMELASQYKSIAEISKTTGWSEATCGKWLRSALVQRRRELQEQVDNFKLYELESLGLLEAELWKQLGAEGLTRRERCQTTESILRIKDTRAKLLNLYDFEQNVNLIVKPLSTEKFYTPDLDRYDEVDNGWKFNPQMAPPDVVQALDLPADTLVLPAERSSGETT